MASFATDPAAALAAYRRHGFHVEHDVWSPDRLEALRTAAFRLTPPDEPAPAPLMNPHRVDATVLAAMGHPPLRAVMERLVGGRVAGLQSQLFFMRPGTPGFTAHQDNFYVEAGRDAFASAWTALEDASAENGALLVWPGSHREPLLPVEEVPAPALHPGQAPNAVRQRTVVPAGYAPLALAVPAGAVVFIHGHLVHGSCDNRSATRSRLALLMTYIREGATFRPGRSAGRRAVSLYADRAS